MKFTEESRAWAKEKMNDILKRLKANADDGGNETFDWFEWGVIYDIVKHQAEQSLLPGIVRPASESAEGGELLPAEGKAQGGSGGLYCECTIPNRNTTANWCGSCNKMIAGRL